MKYVLDRLLSAIALIFLSPLLIAAAFAVLMSMGRPIFFRQLRIGRDGRPFEMLKFRSMAVAEESPYEAPTAISRPVASKAKIAGHVSARSCARPRSTSCRSSSTSCAAT